MTSASFTESMERARRGVGVGGSGKTPRDRRRGIAPGRARTLTLLVLPSIILVLLLNAYPVIYAGVQSLRNGDLIVAGDFIGLKNYTSGG
jgi:multiple sugar transport system permease protein